MKYAPKVIASRFKKIVLGKKCTNRDKAIAD